jgi:hypothetical protein
LVYCLTRTKTLPRWCRRVSRLCRQQLQPETRMLKNLRGNETIWLIARFGVGLLVETLVEMRELDNVCFSRAAQYSIRIICLNIRVMNLWDCARF